MHVSADFYPLMANGTQSEVQTNSRAAAIGNTPLLSVQTGMVGAQVLMLAFSSQVTKQPSSLCDD